MKSPASSSFASDLAAALDWWREAGVDHAFADEPAIWLRPSAARAETAEPPSRPPEGARPPAAPPPAGMAGGDPASWPRDPAAFTEWWLGEPTLDAPGAGPRIAPRGRTGARLMILVPQPEREDRDSLLSGPQGRLLAGFLKAAGIAAEDVYLAAALPRHAPHPDWQTLQRAGFGRIALHHAAIVRPQRLVLFGRDVLALLGNIPAQGPAFLLDLNHQEGSLAALAARSLGHLLNFPSARAGFWRDWLNWTGD